MVGVSNPLFEESVGKGFRFYRGFIVGMLGAAVLIVLLSIPTAGLLAHVPLSVRQALFVLLVGTLIVLDIVGRTPYVQRQVPQRFYLQGIQGGWLGFLYGADMGTHVTTQKTSSLTWIVLGGAILVGDVAEVIAVAATLAVITSVGLLGLAITRQARWLVDLELHSRRRTPWMTYARLLGVVPAGFLAVNEAMRAGWL